jgi:hypothetical protein
MDDDGPAANSPLMSRTECGEGVGRAPHPWSAICLSTAMTSRWMSSFIGMAAHHVSTSTSFTCLA